MRVAVGLVQGGGMQTESDLLIREGLGGPKRGATEAVEDGKWLIQKPGS